MCHSERGSDIRWPCYHIETMPMCLVCDDADINLDFPVGQHTDPDLGHHLEQSMEFVLLYILV